MLMLPDYRVRQRDYLLEIAQAISQELDIDILLKQILQYSTELLAGQAGLIALRDEHQGWQMVVTHGFSLEEISNLDSLFETVKTRQDPLRKEIPEISKKLRKLMQSTDRGVATNVGLPLRTKKEVIGVIFIFRNYASLFSKNDQKLLQNFANQASIAIQNAKLYTQISDEKERMDALLDAVADGILIMNPSKRITRINPTFARLWGEHKDCILGKKHEEIIQFYSIEHGMTLEDAEAGGWPLSSNTAFYVEGDLILPDDSFLPVGITYAPLKSKDGNLMNIIASVRDISHFRQAEELKSTFISVVSHELKTPVALIKGYVSTLRRDDATWDRDIVQDSLEVIEEESDRLAELIENLLDASRIEAGALAMNTIDLSIPTLAQHIANIFKGQSNSHHFIVDFPENFPVVLGDENRISQVFKNLISNAIKYSKYGGEIRIDGYVRKQDVVICVSDQGPGISDQDAPRIFDRFYRAESAMRVHKGAGLGLYLTRAIVEAHNGTIWVDNTYQNGAKICFSLPIAE